MSGIQPTSGVTGPVFPDRTNGPNAQKSPTAKGGFAEALENVIDNVDQDQQSSAEAIRELISGKTQDILPVVQSVAKADLSFKLLIGVRNKVIEAYKQTMQMQV